MATDSTTARCPQCQHPIAPDNTTCPHCGHLLAEETTSAEAPTLAPAAIEPAPLDAAEEPAPADTLEAPLPIVEGSEAEESESATLSEPAAETLESQTSPDAATAASELSASPPTESDTAPSAPKALPALGRKNRKLTAILVAVAALLILSVTGVGILYALTRPQPVISVTSDYHVGNVPAGSTTTSLHVEGRQFSSYSGIIFLLDGHPAPGSQVVPTDENGIFEADLTVTAGWKLGTHQLTARDANGYTTRSSVNVTVVHQGEAHTPGPLGSPADDTSHFSLLLTTITQQVDGSSLPSDQGIPLDLTGSGTPEVLTVQGQPDPKGGSVCNLPQDDGQQHITDISLGDGSVIVGFAPVGGNLVFVQKETTAYTCSGAYQNGKISFTEMNTVDQLVYSNGVTCSLAAPRISYQLEGAFNSATTAIGTYSIPESSLKCSDGTTQESPSENGTWIAFIGM